MHCIASAYTFAHQARAWKMRCERFGGPSVTQYGDRQNIHHMRESWQCTHVCERERERWQCIYVCERERWQLARTYSQVCLALTENTTHFAKGLRERGFWLLNTYPITTTISMKYKGYCSTNMAAWAMLHADSHIHTHRHTRPHVTSHTHATSRMSLMHSPLAPFTMHHFSSPSFSS